LRLVLSLVLALVLAGGAAADAVEVRMSARVAAAPERVLALLADFEAWDRVFTGVETRLAERRGASHARLRQHLRLMGRTVTYTLAAHVDAGARSIELALDPSERNDVAELRTTWRVRPHAEGGSTVELRVVTSSGMAVPAFVERQVTEGTVRATLADLVRALDRVASDAIETSRESG
jgi:carbon monoxide dehydrogenase subunit G